MSRLSKIVLAGACALPGCGETHESMEMSHYTAEVEVGLKDTSYRVRRGFTPQNMEKGYGRAFPSIYTKDEPYICNFRIKGPPVGPKEDEFLLHHDVDRNGEIDLRKEYFEQHPTVEEAVESLRSGNFEKQRDLFLQKEKKSE